MRSFERAAILFCLLLPCANVLAQTQISSKDKDSKATGSVAGRVTLDGKPKSGSEVIALQEGSSGSAAAAKAMTDEDGRYRLASMSAGRYKIVVQSHTNIVQLENSRSRRQDRNPIRR